MNKPDGVAYVLYGDPAYPVRRHIIAPFRGAQLTPAEECFNKDTSTVRTCVELGYGKKVLCIFGFFQKFEIIIGTV